jgi:hypothetical protein
MCEVGRSLAVRIDEDDLSTVSGQAPYDGGPDAACAARHDGDLSLEPVHAISRLASSSALLTFSRPSSRVPLH